MMERLFFDNRIILGPMAGVTDLPFRILCKEQGADIMVTEMVSAKGLYYGSPKTDILLETNEREKPVGLQLFGSDPEIMALEAAKILGVWKDTTDSLSNDTIRGSRSKIAPKDFDFIDINMGCPVPKIVNNGEGSALMKNPELVEAIVSAIVSRFYCRHEKCTRHS